MSIYDHIHSAAVSGTVQDIEFFLKKGVDVNAKADKSRTPLHYAASDNSAEIVQYLISKGAKVDAVDEGGASPLEYAIMKGRVEIIKCLADNGANLNADNAQGMPPMFYAVALGRVDVVKCLVESGGTVDPSHMFQAAQQGNIALMQYLKDQGIDVNFKLGGMMTPLSVAEGEGQTEAATWLRANGAR
jgi:ankyrin repeat protein